MPEFKTYVAALQAATVPPGTTDTLMILQAGGLYLITTAQLLAQTNVQFFDDATVGPVARNIQGYTNVTCGKIDGSANAVTISDSAGNTIMGQANYPIVVQRETVHLVLNGTDWIKI